MTRQPYQKPTIMQVLPSLDSGGVEKIVYEISKFLNNSNYKVIVVSKGGKLANELLAINIDHININIGSKNLLQLIWNIINLKKLIKFHNIDIIHVHSRVPGWVCYFARYKTKVKLITNFHGIYNFTGIFKKFYNSIMTKGDEVIAVSQFVKNHIIDNYCMNANKITVIPNGVDCEQFSKENVTITDRQKILTKYNISKKEPVILLPARFTNWKGHMMLIKSLSLIIPNFKCLMVGDQTKHPNFVKRVKNYIAEVGLQDKIFLYKSESDMPSLYAVVDIIVSASTDPEAFGLTAIEAQAMEKLVIMPGYGATNEIVIDNENYNTGLIYRFKDYEDLADKIKQALNILENEQLEQITTNARFNVIKNFSKALMLQGYLDLYNNFRLYQ